MYDYASVLKETCLLSGKHFQNHLWQKPSGWQNL